MSRKNSKKVINIEVVIVDSFDAQKNREDIVVDVKISRDFSVQHIHDSISSIIHGDNGFAEDGGPSSAQYFLWNSDEVKDNKEPLDVDKSLAQLGINEGDRIIAETSKRKKRSRKFISELDHDEVDDRDTLLLTCTTRIFENEGWVSRKVRVMVKKQQPCSYLMDDVTALWNRSGLKFRYGRTVLNANKTFEELGIVNDGEVVVTGARTV